MAVATHARSASGPRRKLGRRRGRKHGPRSGKKRGFFRRFWWLWTALIAIPLLVAAAGVGFLLYLYAKVQIPEIPPLEQTSYLYYRDPETGKDKLLQAFHAEVDRTVIPLERVAPVMQQAIVAAEDRTFWEHQGVDPKAILRALWADIRNREFVQGGSTITQQYVKNVFTGAERTLERKINEALLAIKLERDPEKVLGLPKGSCPETPCEAAKRAILERYLNTIYFGHGAYGVEAAAKTYFGVRASELKLPQAALLAGIVAAPSRFDPLIKENRATARARRAYVLDRMVLDGYISAEQAAAVKKSKLRLNPPERSFESYSGDYFAWYTRDRLVRAFGEEVVLGHGLRVDTTLRMDYQKLAEKVVERRLGNEGDPDAALVAIDPRNGHILAMYGGEGFGARQFNLATQAQRQAGSAFKTFALAAAVEAGYDVRDSWYGPETATIGDPECRQPDGSAWRPSNAADGQAGTFTLEGATAYSVNTIFARLTMAPKVGPERVAEMARDLGIRVSELEPVCSIALGTNLVTPLEMTSAYATLAAGGVYHPPTPSKRVVNGEGERLRYDPPGREKQVLDENDALIVTHALQRVVDEGTGTAASFGGQPVAGKTGTTQDYKNAWFCGFTPRIAVCVWVGYAKRERPMEYVGGVAGPVFGGTIPADLWREFVGGVYGIEQWGIEPFDQPSYDGYDLPVPAGVSAPAPSPAPTVPQEDRGRPRDEPADEPGTNPGPGGGGGGGDVSPAPSPVPSP